MLHRIAHKLYNGHRLVASGSPEPTPPDPYNPLDLPSNTVRVRTSDGNVPRKLDGITRYETATLVPGTTDVYDVYKSEGFDAMFSYSRNVTEVLGANASNVTNMSNMFNQCTALSSVPLFDTSNVIYIADMFNSCTSLTSIPLFDTSNVTYMYEMFKSCTSLTSVPLFDTSKVTNMEQMFIACTSLINVPLFDTSNVTSMFLTFSNCSSLTSLPLFDTSKVINMGSTFRDCQNVESGALALYQQASTQANPPSNHSQTFTNCGTNTQTGAAELAQIPSDWK